MATTTRIITPRRIVLTDDPLLLLLWGMRAARGPRTASASPPRARRGTPPARRSRSGIAPRSPTRRSGGTWVAWRATSPASGACASTRSRSSPAKPRSSSPAARRGTSSSTPRRSSGRPRRATASPRGASRCPRSRRPCARARTSRSRSTPPSRRPRTAPSGTPACRRCAPRSTRRSPTSSPSTARAAEVCRRGPLLRRTSSSVTPWRVCRSVWAPLFPEGVRWEPVGAFSSHGNRGGPLVQSPTPMGGPTA
mmetsp:Transcript_19162/g.76302  ORF Transcript_19162/g.76302 Transcript_19162/m.76302 type:complete len:252 (+) Transcript_19162:903-1658(+)